MTIKTQLLLLLFIIIILLLSLFIIIIIYHYRDSIARMRAFDFILELLNILKIYKNIYQLMKNHVAIATEESGKLYVPMASKLAELCQLRAE